MLDVPLLEATDEALAGFGRIVSPLSQAAAALSTEPSTRPRVDFFIELGLRPPQDREPPASEADQSLACGRSWAQIHSADEISVPNKNFEILQWCAPAPLPRAASSERQC